MPLEKESLNNFLPDGFETNNLDGYKENFSADKIATGYEKDVKDRVSGPNFNNLLDVIGKNTNVLTKFMDFIKNMPVNNLFAVDENNQLVYKNLDEVGGGGLEIGDIGFTQMVIDETKGKRRKLNGQLIIQEQYLQLTNIIKNSVALNPDLACTESEWQTAITMSTNGICYKFVIDDDAGTIRLPKYPDYLDLSINGAKTVSVMGSGKALGLTDGTTNTGLQCGGGAAYVLQPKSWAYNANVGYNKGSATGDNLKNYVAVGVVTDASKSGLTGSVTTSSEQIRGTYFIQVATGAETEDNIINEIELNNPFSLLDYKYSEYELNNLSWLRSSGQWNSKAIYPAVYELLLKIYNGTETKAGVSVKLATETYTDTDFVLNTADETFMLPIKVKLASGKAVVGNGMTLGLTNGNGSNVGLGYSSSNGHGFEPVQEAYGTSLPVNTNPGQSGAIGYYGITTDPTKSGIETSDSDLYLYFYVGETVQNANLINAGRIEETLAKKVDMQQATIASMPSNRYIDLTLGASGTTYVAPANGYVDFIRTCASTNEFVAMATISENGADLLHTKSTAGTANNTANIYAPVKKGDSFKIVYTATGTAINSLRFIYAEGDQ